MKKLNARQAAFVREYLIDMNASAAATRAGYSPKTARFIGSENMTKPNIQAAIQEAMQARAQRTEITADAVLKELALLGFSDIGQILDFGAASGVQLKPASAIPEGARRAIASMKVKRHVEGTGDNAAEVEVIEFKLWDKLGALVKCGQHLGLFPARVEIGGKDGKPIPIQVIEIVRTTPKCPNSTT